jgi:hypothetical protein
VVKSQRVMPVAGAEECSLMVTVLVLV